MPDEKRERFNLKTMSGIYPGTRTKIFQRIIVSAELDSTLGEAETLIPNAQIAWYADPVACVVKMDGADDALLRVEAALEPVADRAAFWATLVAGLDDDGLALRTCGTCAYMQGLSHTTVDELPVGVCGMGGVDPAEDESLGHQSLLALACPMWTPREALITLSNPLDDGSREAVVDPNGMADAAGGATEPRDVDAQQDDSLFLKRGGIFSRLKRLFGQKPPVAPTPQSRERSGVGAGTESCFACQGRIANLGALVVQTDEGDKQTLSVWRCRNCYTFYLNSWVDRWERLDNLETEEVYYRLAPSEARTLLREIDSVHMAITHRAEQTAA